MTNPTPITDEQRQEVQEYIASMMAQWADFIDLLDKSGVLPPTRKTND